VKIKRYDPDDWDSGPPLDDGPYCKNADVLALESKLDAVRKICDEAKSEFVDLDEVMQRIRAVVAS
jgi:hypothetical protein